MVLQVALKPYLPQSREHKGYIPKIRDEKRCGSIGPGGWQIEPIRRHHLRRNHHSQTVATQVSHPGMRRQSRKHDTTKARNKACRVTGRGTAFEVHSSLLPFLVSGFPVFRAFALSCFRDSLNRPNNTKAAARMKGRNSHE
jgi:hypothetical protein